MAYPAYLSTWPPLAIFCLGGLLAPFAQFFSGWFIAPAFSPHVNRNPPPLLRPRLIIKSNARLNQSLVRESLAPR